MRQRENASWLNDLGRFVKEENVETSTFFKCIWVAPAEKTKKFFVNETAFNMTWLGVG